MTLGEGVEYRSACFSPTGTGENVQRWRVEKGSHSLSFICHPHCSLSLSLSLSHTHTQTHTPTHTHTQQHTTPPPPHPPPPPHTRSHNPFTVLCTHTPSPG